MTESGNVGIGTTAPQGRLQVVTANDSAPATITAWDARHFVVGAGGRTGGIGMSYDQTNNVGYIEALSPNAFWRNLVLQSGGGNVGIGTAAPADVLHVVGVGTAIRATDGPVATRLFSSNATGKGYVGTTGGAYPFVLRTADADRVTIDATGNVGIGTAMPDLALSVSGNADKSVGGGSWASFSDERLKNIKGRFTPGLKAVMQLQPLRYEYKRDNALGIKSEGVQIGFTAQAVQKLIPEAVTKNDKGYLLINNDPILWTMLNAIKEQQEEIAQKDAEIKALNVRLRAVETVLRKEVGPGLHRR